jgi:hypothetical protein
MNDSCTQIALDVGVAESQERSLLDSIFEKFTPDQTSQKIDLCRARENTPYSEIVLYSNDLKMSMNTGTRLVQMNLTEHGHTIFDKNALGNNRLLLRTNTDATFGTVSEAAYKYDADGKLIEVIEHSSSTKFEVMRRHTLTPVGWKEEQWNRYGTQFNKMPTIIGQTDFRAEHDGSVLRITRTLDTPLGAAPINRRSVETHTTYDSQGRVVIVKQ